VYKGLPPAISRLGFGIRSGHPDPIAVATKDQIPIVEGPEVRTTPFWKCSLVLKVEVIVGKIIGADEGGLLVDNRCLVLIFGSEI
jgi:hypothetical protein